MTPSDASLHAEGISLSDSEKELLRKATESRKGGPLAELSEATLDGRQLTPDVLAPAVEILTQSKWGGLDHMAAAIICRQLPPGSPEADRVGKHLHDRFGTLEMQQAGAGCLASLLYLAASFTASSTVHATPRQPDLSSVYRPYLRPLSALQSPHGASVAASLALGQPHKDPADLGSEALAALPPLLRLAAAVKPGELSEGDANCILRLVNADWIPDETKVLALKAAEAIGSHTTGVLLKGYHRDNWSPALAMEADHVIDVLAARA